MKLTYSDIKDVVEELGNSDIYIFNSINGTTERLNINETEGYELLNSFIEQHKPLTLNELTLKWKELGFKVIENLGSLTLTRSNGVYDKKIIISGTAQMARVDNLSLEEVELLYKTLHTLKK